MIKKGHFNFFSLKLANFKTFSNSLASYRFSLLKYFVGKMFIFIIKR